MSDAVAAEAGCPRRHGDAWRCLLGGLALLAGCAGGPVFQDDGRADAACIEGSHANPVRFYTSGDAQVYFVRIDDLPVSFAKGYFGPHCLAPGRHRVGVVAANCNVSLQQDLALDVRAGARYVLRANFQDSDFLFRLFEVGGEAPTELARYRFPAGQARRCLPTMFFPPS